MAEPIDPSPLSGLRAFARWLVLVLGGTSLFSAFYISGYIAPAWRDELRHGNGGQFFTYTQLGAAAGTAAVALSKRYGARALVVAGSVAQAVALAAMAWLPATQAAAPMAVVGAAFALPWLLEDAYVSGVTVRRDARVAARAGVRLLVAMLCGLAVHRIGILRLSEIDSKYGLLFAAGTSAVFGVLAGVVMDKPVERGSWRQVGASYRGLLGSGFVWAAMGAMAASGMSIAAFDAYQTSYLRPRVGDLFLYVLGFTFLAGGLVTLALEVWLIKRQRLTLAGAMVATATSGAMLIAAERLRQDDPVWGLLQVLGHIDMECGSSMMTLFAAALARRWLRAEVALMATALLLGAKSLGGALGPHLAKGPWEDGLARANVEAGWIGVQQVVIGGGLVGLCLLGALFALYLSRWGWLRDRDSAFGPPALFATSELLRIHAGVVSAAGQSRRLRPGHRVHVHVQVKRRQQPLLVATLRLARRGAAPPWDRQLVRGSREVASGSGRPVEIRWHTRSQGLVRASGVVCVNDLDVERVALSLTAPAGTGGARRGGRRHRRPTPSRRRR